MTQPESAYTFLVPHHPLPSPRNLVPGNFIFFYCMVIWMFGLAFSVLFRFDQAIFEVRLRWVKGMGRKGGGPYYYA